MKTLTSLLLIGILFFSNINAISIKKNYLGLSSKKGILSDLLTKNIEVSKEQNDEYTLLTFIIHHDKPLKDRSEQQVREIAKAITDYLMGVEEEAIQQLAQQQPQQQVPQQVQKDVQDAVEQLKDLAQEQDVTSQQVQKAVEQILQQLPQETAEQIQEVIQQLPKQQQVTPKQIQQVIDQVQQAQQNIDFNPLDAIKDLVDKINKAADDALFNLEELKNKKKSKKR